MPITNPFPGMNPYLEQHWRDVHHRLVTYACDHLQEHLPSDLRARMEERVCVESEDVQRHSLYPDVRVIERPNRGSGGVAIAESGISIAEPLVIQLPSEPPTETFIEIIDVGTGNRIVSVIEVLSPTNKLPGEGSEQYRRKQRELADAHVSLVEIDLLRSGNHVLVVPLSRLDPKSWTPYMICVRRGWKPTVVEVYRAPLQTRLPIIRVPLRETDKDVTLDVQALIDQCYRNGRYDDIDYRRPPIPPLDPGDAQWADEMLRQKGLR